MLKNWVAQKHGVCDLRILPEYKKNALETMPAPLFTSFPQEASERMIAEFIFIAINNLSSAPFAQY